MGLHNGPYRHSTKKLDNRQQGRLEPRTTDGQLRSGRRYQCDNTIPNISTGIAKLSNKKKNKKGSRAFSILNLPRELRDEIYRELLLADKIRSTNIITGKATFEPVILRVNKQLHEEGSRILYYENKWLIITMNRPYGRPTAFDCEPALLQVDLQGPPSLTTPWQALLFDIFNVPHPHQTFNQLTKGCDLKQINFSVQFHPRVRTMPDVCESLLLCLRAIRGVGNATVSGIETSTASELATLMMTPIKSMDEIWELIDTYQRRGDRQLAYGNIVDAARTYIGGIEYVDWVLYRGLRRRLSDNDLQSLWELIYRRSAMSIDCAVCKIKLGLLNHGLHRLQMILRTQLPDIQRAKANYHSGLVFLELGKEDFARAAFEVALIAQPRHEGAKKEVENFQRRDTIKELRKEHPKLRKCLLPPAMI